MPISFRQSSCDSDRLIFRAGSRSTVVYDLQMVNGDIKLFSVDEMNSKKAFGLQTVGQARDLDFIGTNLVNIVTDIGEELWYEEVNVTADKLKKMKETLLAELPKIIKIPAGLMLKEGANQGLPTQNFLLAIWSQHISIVNTAEKKDYVIVQQRAHSEHDRIAHAFLTHKHRDGNACNSENCSKKELVALTLHYFERFYDADFRLKNATYNTFDLTEDFLSMIRDCGLVIPSEKTLLTREIKKFKQKKKELKEAKSVAPAAQQENQDEQAKKDKEIAD